MTLEKEAAHVGSAGGNAQGTNENTRQPTGVTGTDKPIVAVQIKNVFSIPKAISALPRWLLWRYEFVKGAWTKVPKHCTQGHSIDATNFANGVPLDKAFNTLQSKPDRCDGMGFMLGDGIGGIDVDDCRDPITGQLDARGQALSDRFSATYAEVSPSGTGFKIFVDLGDDAVLRQQKGITSEEIEIYAQGRYFTVTGHLLPGHAKEVKRMPDEFRALYEEHGHLRQPKSDSGDDASTDPIRWVHFKPGITMEPVRAALGDADCMEPDWFKRLMAIELQWGEEGRSMAREWSATGAKYPGDDGFDEKYDHARSRNDTLTKGDDVYTVARIIADAANSAKKSAAPKGLDVFTLTKGSDLMKFDEPPTFSTALGVACPIGVVMCAGLGGTGKTTVAATLSVSVTNTVPCPPWESRLAQRAAAGVLWLTTEEDRDRIVLPRHAALGGNLDLLFVPTIKTEDGNDGRPRAVGFEIDKHLPSMLRQARQAGTPIKLVVADALPALVNWDGRSPNSDADVKQLISELTAIAMEFDCCIFGIAHFNKKADMADEYRMSGAQAWRESPRLSFICAAGHIYVNKTNDLREVGCTFEQQVIKVLYEVDAETPDGKPIQVAARRAVFGAHLLPKGDVLALIDVAKAAAKNEARADREQRPGRVEAMAAIVRDLFAVLGDDVPAALVWDEVGRLYLSDPNGAEKVEIANLVGIAHARVGPKHVYRLLPRAMPD